MALYVTLTYSHQCVLFYFLSFLILSDYKMLQDHLVNFLFQNQPFVLGFDCRMIIKIKFWLLGMLLATRMSLLLAPLNLQSKKNICVCILVHVPINISILIFCIYIKLNTNLIKCLQFQSINIWIIPHPSFLSILSARNTFKG